MLRLEKGQEREELKTKTESVRYREKMCEDDSQEINLSQCS